MSRLNQPWWPVHSADLAWAGDTTPRSSRFGDVYYSRDDGMAESEHVFLHGNDLPQRWRHHAGAFRIVETGFGTGLNALLTWLQWRNLTGERPRLHIVSIEKYPLQRDDLARALGAWPTLAPLAAALLDAWPDLLPGQHRLTFDDGDVILDLWWEDVADALADLAARGPAVDAWYLDGFAPARNADMWTEALFQAMAAASRPGATFATFTAAGQVRRGLSSAGFRVEKVPGYGRKRESLRGVWPGTHADFPTPDTPWEQPLAPRSVPRSALVLGAGLAGCSTARALAERGVEVTLLDAGAMAGAASGNCQGILYTRLSRRHSTLTDFALQSFDFAARRYAAMFANGALVEGDDGALCGSFHQSTDDEELALLAERLATLPSLARVLTADEARDRLGVQPALGGYWYPRSGWLHPPAVCRAMAAHPGITVHEHCGPLTLRTDADAWQAHSAEGVVATGKAAIICTGTDTRALAGLDWLPLQAIRGQTTWIPATPETTRLQAAFCHEGYIAPARASQHCIGATFNLRDADAQTRVADHRHNLDTLARALPDWSEALHALDCRALAGRVGFRCASPDYLPLAGPVPDRAAFLQTFAALRQNARQRIPSRGNYVPGLYVNTAHGSRGLSSTPLVGELLASMICNEPLPVSRELERALSPARFLVRDLGRNRL